MLRSGKVSFDSKRYARGHANKYWAVALARQMDHQANGPHTDEIGVRVLG